MIIKSTYPLLFIFLNVLISSCAQQVAPTGGEKDTIPPKVLTTNPKNESINFTNQNIILHFDEYIKLQQLKKELLISPPLKYDLETQIKKKSLTLKIKDTLKENTTYVFNFGNAIVDITEGNPLSNYNYVISTGNHIDSMSISGRIVNAENLKVESDVLILLHEKSTKDSIISKERPNYVSRSNKEGLFTIANLKEGEYQLFALKDKNNNFLFDQKEALAFLSHTIEVNSSNIDDSIKLYLFEEEERNQFIEERKQEGPKLSLNFKSSLTDFNFNLIDTLNELILFSEISDDQKTAVLWFNEMPRERLKLEVTDDTLFIDTINVRIDSLKGDSNLALAKGLSSKLAYYQAYEIQFKRPIQNFDTSKILLFNKDSIPINFKIGRDSLNAALFYLNSEFEEDSSYQLIINKGAFTDYYGKENDSIGRNFKVDNSTLYSQLTIKLTIETQTPLILQLTSENGEDILQSFKVKDLLVDIQNLKEGSYGLKLIFDSNANGKWDTGDYYKGIQPERVWVYDEPIELRQSWDQEIEWVIQQK